MASVTDAQVVSQEPVESVEQGAAGSFADNAPSWQDLQRKVQERQKELQWELPDLENVWIFCCRQQALLCL